MKKTFNFQSSNNSAATAAQQQQQQRSNSFSTNTYRGYLLMALFVCLFVVGGGQSAWAQLSVNITQPDATKPALAVNLNVANIYPYNGGLVPHQGIEVIARLTFDFKDAAGASLYLTTLPISFFTNDVGMSWTSANFINNYVVSPCTNNTVKSVVISTNVSLNLSDAIPNGDLTINYTNGVTPTIVSLTYTSTYNDTKTITFPSALNASVPLSTTIQQSIYRCDQLGTGAGYLLSTVTQGGCATSLSSTATTYNAYSEPVWHDITTNTTPIMVPDNAFAWSRNIFIGRTGTNIAGLALGIPGHTYTATVTDANGNTATASYTVPTQIPNQFTTTISNTANCNQQVSISSLLIGKGTYLHLTGAGATFNYTATANAPYTSNPIPLAPGDYVLHVEPSIESAYCSETTYPIHIGATITPISNNGCITALSANAGATAYVWSTGQTTQNITPTNIGTYTVTVTNAISCSIATYTLTGGNTIACCQAGLTYQINTPSYTATSGTWANGSNPFGNTANALNINANFVVPNGVTLTINNMNLNFSATSKITILKGGLLKLNGCTLDGLCNGMWLGIQVEGNGLSIIPPAPLPAGYINPGGLYTNTNTQINNAVIGITNTLLPTLTIADIATALLNSSETLPGFLSYSLSSVIFDNTILTNNAILKAGGVVNAQNTTFNNCFQGINLNWRGHKFNKIDRCTFNSPATGSLQYPFNTAVPPTKSEVGVALMGAPTDEIGTAWTLTAITNCTFNRSKFGIRTNAINYITIEDCIFNGNKIGTSVAHFLEDASSLVKIRQNTYDNCALAIQASGVDNLSIRDNHINENYNQYSTDRKVGIYTRGSNPIVRNNTIGGTQYGVILTDTEADGSLLAGNVLNHNFIPLTAEGDNTGIVTRCNHLLNRTGYGIQIRPWTSNNEPGDLGHQGNCFGNQPAAFTFTTAVGIGNPIAIRLDANTNPFILEDVGANLLSSSTAGGTCTKIDCSVVGGYDLNEYCANQGYTSIDDISNLIGSGGISDKALSDLLVQYLDAEDYTAALQLIYNYQNTLVMQRRLIPQNIIADSTANAQQLLQQLPNNTEETYQYKRFYTLLSNLKAEHRNLINITPAEQSLLMDIANSRTKTAFKAQACLYVARGIEFGVLLPTDNGDYTVFKNNEDAIVTNKVSTFKPNPANNNAQLSYNLEQETATLSIYDYTGRKIEQVRLTGTGSYQFNTTNYTSGIYVYTVNVNGNAILQDKLVIVK